MFNKFFIFVALFAFFVLAASPAWSASADLEADKNIFTSDDPLVFFSDWLYPTLLAAAALLAVLMITIAGFKWMAGAASEPQVKEAKDIISTSLWGLALALTSWIILYTINPDLVTLRRPAIETLEQFGGGARYQCGYNGEIFDSEAACQLSCPGDSGVTVCTPTGGERVCYYGSEGGADGTYYANLTDCQAAVGIDPIPPTACEYQIVEDSTSCN